MRNQLIGRIKEQAILKKAWTSNRAEMVAIIGRRRVGKTFLFVPFLMMSLILKLQVFKMRHKKNN